MAKVVMRYTRGGKEKAMAEPFARVLEKVGLATRVIKAPEPVKKKRGRPKKVTGSGALAAQSSTARTYQRRDLKAGD